MIFEPDDQGPTASPRPSMVDVAQLAGVSAQTVARVVNGQPHVRPETERAVQNAIQALGYTKNRAARALATNQSGLIGVAVAGIPVFGPTSVLIAIEEAARAVDLHVCLTTIGDMDGNAVERALTQLMDRGVDGIIVIAVRDAAVEAVRRFEASVPVVMVAAVDPDARILTVGVDQYSGGRLAARHLLDLGHTDLLHLASPQDWILARERARGWSDEVTAAGLEVRSRACRWDSQSGYEIALELIEEGLPTGIFAGNDQIALGVLRAFAQMGIRVPHDVSLVGFDDIEGSAHFSPPLTTVHQDYAELGVRCLEVLHAAIEGSRETSGPLPTRLIIRESTGAPPDAS